MSIDAAIVVTTHAITSPIPIATCRASSGLFTPSVSPVSEGFLERKVVDGISPVSEGFLAPTA